MPYRAIRRLLNPLYRTPLHPQWFCSRTDKKTRVTARSVLNGRVLDIGCADQYLSSLLKPDCEYIGLDYPATGATWYDSRPKVFGDAQKLPFADASMDSVALLDVLEHLPETKSSLSEIARVLRPGGILLLQVPFLYPIHDAPYDFQRWTIHGLRRALNDNGLNIISETAEGHPLETAALLTSIAIARLAAEYLRQRSILLLFALPFAAITVPLINIAAWLISLATPTDDFMPYSYRIVCHRPN